MAPPIRQLASSGIRSKLPIERRRCRHGARSDRLHLAAHMQCGFRWSSQCFGELVRWCHLDEWSSLTRRYRHNRRLDWGGSWDRRRPKRQPRRVLVSAAGGSGSAPGAPQLASLPDQRRCVTEVTAHGSLWVGSARAAKGGVLQPLADLIWICTFEDRRC